MNTKPIHKGTSTLVRPKFAAGMLLQHEDLELMTAYTRELSRLIWRSVLGCGVVCGLVIEASEKCGRLAITVGAGLALDCDGDPVHVSKPQTFEVGGECEAPLEAPLYVLLCGTTRACAPRPAMCTEDDDAPASPTREREGWEIRIEAEPMGCGCKSERATAWRPNMCRCANPASPCHVDHYAGLCGCQCIDTDHDEGGCGCCDCECILLAKLDRTGPTEKPWEVDHRVRRFIRPVLMRDPQVEKEDEARRKDTGEEEAERTSGMGMDLGGVEVRPVPVVPPANLAGTRRRVRKTPGPGR